MVNDPEPCPQPRVHGRSGMTSKPLALPASTTASPTLSPRLKRLTPEEMAAKRERRECYNCTEKFSCDHLKVCHMKGIYLLQMDDMSREAVETGRTRSFH
jgi:hypothetical protein